MQLAFARGREGLDQQIWHQIEIDVPRTRPGVMLWMEGGTQRVSSFHQRLMPPILFGCGRIRNPDYVSTPPPEFRTDTLRLGYPTSGERVCARYQ